MKQLSMDRLYSKLYDRDKQFAVKLYMEFINDISCSNERHCLKRFTHFIENLIKRDIVIYVSGKGFEYLSYEDIVKCMTIFLDEKVCERYGFENNGPFNGWLHDMYKFLVLEYNPKAKCEDCEYCKYADVSYKTFYCLAENNKILGVDYAPKKSPSWCPFKNEKYTIKKGGG